jgi:hypothetical protein
VRIGIPSSKFSIVCARGASAFGGDLRFAIVDL